MEDCCNTESVCINAMTCTCVRAELGAIGTSKEAQLSAVASDENVAGSARVNLWKFRKVQRCFRCCSYVNLANHNLLGGEFEQGTHAWKCRGARRESRGGRLVAGPENETDARLARERDAARVCA